MIPVSGAQVASAYCKGLGLVQTTSQAVDWWATVGAKTTTPANAVVFYDPAGVKDGRLMLGEEIVHPGLQVLVRSDGYAKGWQKIVSLQQALQAAFNAGVTIPGYGTVVLCAFSLTMPPSHVGQEQDQPRQLFSMNGTLTLR